MIFSMCSIVKSAYEFNFSPLFEKENSMSIFKVSCSIFLQTIPFLLFNILFRVCCYSFILVYIDYWALIPFTTLFFINVVICGISFIEFPENKDELDQSRNLKCGTLNPEEFECETIGWNPNIVVATNNIVPDELDFNEDPAVISPGAVNLSLKEDSLNVNKAKKTPTNINEENTPVFLNSVAGFFFPSCHTKVNSSTENNIGSENIYDIISWQMKIYKKQILLFNTVLLVIVGAIFVLVTSVDSFNYKSNVLNICLLYTSPSPRDS